MSFSPTVINQVWNEARFVPNANPNEYRQDPYGNLLRYDHYGRFEDMGWEIDHIVPRAHGGGDHIQNLQAMRTTVNRQMGDSLFKRNRYMQ